MPIKEYMELMTSNNLPGLNYFISVMIGLAVGIGFLVIFLSMYTTITERTREIGILKSLGASKTYIISVILREAALLTAVGIIAGYHRVGDYAESIHRHSSPRCPSNSLGTGDFTPPVWR